jgi:hypothetical protein
MKSQKKSPYFPSKKRSFEDSKEYNAHAIVRNYKASKLRRKLNKNHQIPLCAICLDDCLHQCSPNACKHSFCFLCISQWGKMSPICPLCKIEFQSVSTPDGEILSSFEKKNLDEGGEISTERDEYSGEGNGDGDDLNILQIQDRSHGYQLDGFVVDDDFIEFDEF